MWLSNEGKGERRQKVRGGDDGMNREEVKSEEMR